MTTKIKGGVKALVVGPLAEELFLRHPIVAQILARFKKKILKMPARDYQSIKQRRLLILNKDIFSVYGNTRALITRRLSGGSWRNWTLQISSLR